MASKKSTLKFVVSKEKQPQVQLKPGMKLEVQAVQLVDARMKAIKAKVGAARLCGGTSTCLALLNIDAEIK